MSKEAGKRAAAKRVLEHVNTGEILGVGTGSTVNLFIDALAGVADKIPGAVSSSEASSERLRRNGIKVLDLNEVDAISVYVDGADESDASLSLIKGGGGALTREKIIASVAETFLCIADDSKLVATLGAFPLPVEVIPMAREHVARQLRALGGEPVWRKDFVTDNGNHILDVKGLQITDPVALETELDHIVGTVTNGLFARRGADLLFLGNADGSCRVMKR